MLHRRFARLSLTSQIRIAIVIYGLIGAVAGFVCIVAYSLARALPRGSAYGPSAVAAVAAISVCGTILAYRFTKQRLVERALLRAVHEVLEEDVAAARRRVKEIEECFVVVPGYLVECAALIESAALGSSGQFASAVEVLDRVDVTVVASARRRAALLDTKAFYGALAGDGHRAIALAGEALAVLHWSHERDPRLHAAVQRTLAVAYVVTGEYSRAIALFDRAEPNPTACGDACILFHHARALFAEGDRDGGMLLLERAASRKNYAGQVSLWGRRAAALLPEHRSAPYRSSVGAPLDAGTIRAS